jgi:hypothetical protein
LVNGVIPVTGPFLPIIRTRGENVSEGVDVKRTECKIVDGTSLLDTTMSSWCSQTKKRITVNEINVGYMKREFDGLDEMKQALKDLGYSFANTIPGYIAAKAIWNGDLGSAVIDFLQAPIAIVGNAVCALGLGGCTSTVGSGIGLNHQTFVSRAKYAVPTLTGLDSNTLRVVTTGEGKDKSYAEYFLPVKDPFVQKMLTEVGSVPGSEEEVVVALGTST